MDNNLLSLLGLARRAGMVQMGEDAAAESVDGRAARLLALASDAGGNTARRAAQLAARSGVLLIRLPSSKTELGSALGCASCAVLALEDLGFAAAAVDRLAQTDPKQYGPVLEKLKLKVKRAAERKELRRAERAADKKDTRPAPEGRKEPRRTERPAQDKDVRRTHLNGDRGTAPPPQAGRDRRFSPQSPRSDAAAGTAPDRRRPGERGAVPPGGRQRPGKGAPGFSRTGGKPTDRASGFSHTGGQARPPLHGGKSDGPKYGKSFGRFHSRPVKKGKGSFRKKDQS
ncbi:MAG: hypothetical protein LKJ80_03880 [Oscillibacter sp.]|jgi:ribosomal protein L7Ae-like RNA K-turn-binding protein|nr:hypothetical protein [Oscillibacter sp.]